MHIALPKDTSPLGTEATRSTCACRTVTKRNWQRQETTRIKSAGILVISIIKILLNEMDKRASGDVLLPFCQWPKSHFL